jgi:hypothetical protein
MTVFGLGPPMVPPFRTEHRANTSGLEVRARNAYRHPMDGTPHHKADWEPPIPTEAELLAALDESMAELAAGVPTVPGKVVRTRPYAAAL